MRITRVLVKHKLVHEHQLFLNPASVPEQFCSTLTAEFLSYYFDEFYTYIQCILFLMSVCMLQILLASQRSSSDRRNAKQKGRINICQFLSASVTFTINFKIIFDSHIKHFIHSCYSYTYSILICVAEYLNICTYTLQLSAYIYRHNVSYFHVHMGISINHSEKIK